MSLPSMLRGRWRREEEERRRRREIINYFLYFQKQEI
jgi:hypothetical protein